jgi:hypothetical protein
MKRPIVVTLPGSVLIVVALAGCSAFHHAADPAAAQATPAAATRSTAAAAQAHLGLACSEQAAWDKRGAASVKALYADTGALAADASAGTQPGVVKAGRTLTSDAIAAATLPLPPVDPDSWKTLTADYAAAGTRIATGDESGAVAQLEAGNAAISAFSGATGKCSGVKT